MNLYKRDRSPYYHYRFNVNGKEYRGSTKRKDKQSANRVMMAEYNKIMDISQHGEKPEITLKDACTLTVGSVEGRTKESYQYATNKLLGLTAAFQGRWALGPERHLSSLTDDDLDDHRMARQEEGMRPNTVNLELRFLKRVNNYCRKRFRTNPDLDFRMLKGFAKCRSLSISEERAVIAYCLEKEAEFGEGAWQKAHDLFIYLIDTGVRLGEALAVEWPDIDLNEKEIDNYNFKTGKSVFVPISDRVAEMLSRLQEQDRPFTSMDRAVKNLREAIRVMCPSTHRVLNEKGKATIHSCRDTYATRMLNKGMRLEEVSHLLGHATVQQTQKYAKFANRPVAAKARVYLNSD